MADIDEIVHTIERLQGEFEDLAVRGLRTAGPAHVRSLQALREEFERIGAGHLAGRIGDVIAAIEKEERGAATALLRAQASLAVFERIATLETAATLLEALAQSPGDVPEESEDDT
jgi:hypothetical protein